MADNTRNLEFLRQFVSPFIDGENAAAILGSLADEDKRLEDLNIARSRRG